MSGPTLKVAIPHYRSTCPRSHRYYAEWNPARFIQWAGKTGEATARLVETILTTRPYPEQGLQSLSGDY